MYKSFFGMFILFAIIASSCKKTSTETNSILLLNHTGYKLTSTKKVVLQTTSNYNPKTFEVLTTNNEVVFKGKFDDGGQIDNWHTGKAYSGDFSSLNSEGQFYLKTEVNGSILKSRVFNIDNKNLAQKSLSLLIEGFETQHISGDFQEKDAKMTFFGDRKDTVDVSGGWYDASGDRGKYFSHLCYSNYFNPQQTPLVVWNMLVASDKYLSENTPEKAELKNRILKEATYGADFLMRMNDKDGYFYTNIFAKWSGKAKDREICAYETQDGNKTTEYQAGFREGAGIAIAALARASKILKSGEFTSEQYLKTAQKAFNHLLEFNEKYIDDGKENIIDEYCSLIAASELFEATNETKYLEYAQKRMNQLSSRISNDKKYSGWWRSDETGKRPFFHAVESGFPVIALCRYLDIEKDNTNRQKAIEAIKQSVDFELKITNEVNNPFGYPRQYVKAINEETSRSAFFIPHQNETGYWWQGEDSRIASIASSFYLAQPYLTDNQKKATLQMASNGLNWIFGLNPYDVCMVDGIGYNNPDYIEEYNRNFKGGVANGITAGFEDESDIGFMPLPQNNDGEQKWRWSEQWIPHAAWLILAVCTENE
ncbi:MAG: chitobiase [Flavobacteriaceae bacterium]|nr:MAG: chitobiase [Flavobacteriaceae bacterium]